MSQNSDLGPKKPSRPENTSTSSFTTTSYSDKGKDGRKSTPRNCVLCKVRHGLRSCNQLSK